MVFKKKRKIDLEKYKTPIITGIIAAVVSGIVVTTYKFFLDKETALVVPAIKKFNLNLTEFYTLDNYEINDLQDKDSSTWDFNGGIKMAGFYFTSFFNQYTGIKKNIDIRKDEYFCNRYDLKSIAHVSGLSIHNPSVTQHEGVREDYYNGTIKDGFAYYNPEIISWAFDNLLPKPNEKNIQGFMFQEIYNELYKNNIRLIAECYLLFPDEKSYKTAQVEYLGAMEIENFNGSEYLFKKYGSEGSCQFCFGKHLAIGFWLRRGIDGTNDEIWQGLSKVLKTYDKEWFNVKMTADKTVWKNS